MARSRAQPGRYVLCRYVMQDLSPEAASCQGCTLCRAVPAGGKAPGFHPGGDGLQAARLDKLSRTTPRQSEPARAATGGGKAAQGRPRGRPPPPAREGPPGPDRERPRAGGAPPSPAGGGPPTGREGPGPGRPPEGAKARTGPGGAHPEPRRRAARNGGGPAGRGDGGRAAREEGGPEAQGRRATRREQSPTGRATGRQRTPTGPQAGRGPRKRTGTGTGPGRRPYRRSPGTGHATTSGPPTAREGTPRSGGASSHGPRHAEAVTICYRPRSGCGSVHFNPVRPFFPAVSSFAVCKPGFAR